MDKFQKSVIKSRILNLARLRATGTPAEMAVRFNTSCRTVKRIVSEMRAEGYALVYDFYSSSYVIEGCDSLGSLNDDCLVFSTDNSGNAGYFKDEYQK